jgi:hypothetical protein
MYIEYPAYGPKVKLENMGKGTCFQLYGKPFYMVGEGAVKMASPERKILAVDLQFDSLVSFPLDTEAYPISVKLVILPT